MGTTTGIEWTDKTHNFWYGCKKVSQGCAHCYAEREMEWFGRDFKVVTRAKGFDKPLSWKEPSKIFVNSWSDFFIEDADGWREAAWDIIWRTPRHTYQILTKRPERIKECLPPFWNEIRSRVWLGVSVEDQKTARLRIPILLDAPAYVRFISCEPLLGPVSLGGATPDLEAGWEYVNTHWDDDEPEEMIEECEAENDWVNYGDNLVVNPEYREWMIDRKNGAKYHTFREMIDWVIVGGESGPGCRPMELEWARSIVELCRDMKTPVFVKQLGGWPDKQVDTDGWPEDLRVREWPT